MWVLFDRSRSSAANSPTGGCCWNAGACCWKRPISSPLMPKRFARLGNASDHRDRSPWYRPPDFFPLIEKLATKSNTQPSVLTEVLAGAWNGWNRDADIVVAPDMHFRSSSEINSPQTLFGAERHVAAGRITLFTVRAGAAFRGDAGEISRRGGGRYRP